MFILSSLSRKFSNYIFSRRYKVGMYNEVAEYLISIKNEGCFLDIGTGGGFLLKSLFDLNPELDLHAIELNKSMVSIAKKNLKKYNITGAIKHMSIE